MRILLGSAGVVLGLGALVACASATETGASNEAAITSTASAATVITPFGRMKAACGHVVADGEVVDTSKSVAGCSASTARAATTNADAGGNDVEPPSWASWLEDDTTTGVSYLAADMVVPPLPATQSQQVVYMFPSLTPAENPPIIQPVLEYGYGGSGSDTIGGHYWTIANWYLDEQANYWISKVVKVAPGDKLHGTIQGTGTCSGGVCSSWTITLADLTQPSLTTTLTTAAGGYKYTQLQGAVVETYNITSCSMMPAGPLAFTNIAAKANDGSAFTPTWRFLDVPADITPCNIAVTYPAADATSFTFTKK